MTININAPFNNFDRRTPSRPAPLMVVEVITKGQQKTHSTPQAHEKLYKSLPPLKTFQN